MDYSPSSEKEPSTGKVVNEAFSAWIRGLSKLDLKEDLNQIWDSISDQDIKTISSFGRVISRHDELFEKYWHLTRNAEEYKKFRPSDVYTYHDTQNNILNSGLDQSILGPLESIQNKITKSVVSVATTLYPAFVCSYLTGERERLPIHTHKKPVLVQGKDAAALSLSFAIRMTPAPVEDEGTRLRFYPSPESGPGRLQEELGNNQAQQVLEFRPQNISAYMFATETAAHTAIFGRSLYCWLIFDHLEFNFDFDPKVYHNANKVFSLDLDKSDL